MATTLISPFENIFLERPTLEFKRTNNHFDQYDRIISFWKIKAS